MTIRLSQLTHQTVDLQMENVNTEQQNDASLHDNSCVSVDKGQEINFASTLLNMGWNLC